MVKYTEAMVGSEISSENFQYFVNSTLYRTDFYAVNIQAKIEQKSYLFDVGVGSTGSPTGQGPTRQAHPRTANSFYFDVFERMFDKIE